MMIFNFKFGKREVAVVTAGSLLYLGTVGSIELDQAHDAGHGLARYASITSGATGTGAVNSIVLVQPHDAVNESPFDLAVHAAAKAPVAADGRSVEDLTIKFLKKLRS